MPISSVVSSNLKKTTEQIEYNLTKLSRKRRIAAFIIDLSVVTALFSGVVLKSSKADKAAVMSIENNIIRKKLIVVLKNVGNFDFYTALLKFKSIDFLLTQKKAIFVRSSTELI